MCSVLPAYHYITRCDTTSYPPNIGKVRPFQKLVEKQAFNFLKTLGSHSNSYKNVEHSKTSYYTIMHSRLPEESIAETRVGMYQKQNIKTSSTLILYTQMIIYPGKKAQGLFYLITSLGTFS